MYAPLLLSDVLMFLTENGKAGAARHPLPETPVRQVGARPQTTWTRRARIYSFDLLGFILYFVFLPHVYYHFIKIWGALNIPKPSCSASWSSVLVSLFQFWFGCWFLLYTKLMTSYGKVYVAAEFLFFIRNICSFIDFSLLGIIKMGYFTNYECHEYSWMMSIRIRLRSMETCWWILMINFND